MNLRNPLKHMIMMESVLDWVMDHLEEKISIEDVARMYDYNPVHFARIFLEYFEYPFGRYIVMLRMRRAAKRILVTRSLRDVGNTYGYATAASFSKAFRNEFGISPREFLKKAYSPPDMPERHKIHQTPISLEYVSLQPFSVGGYPVPAPYNAGKQEGKDEVYPCDPPEAAGEEERAVLFGLWQTDERGNDHYLIGPELLKGSRRKKIMRRVRFKAADYAEFSFEPKGSAKETTDFTRLLSRYIFHEWMVVNEKVLDEKLCPFARFEDDRVRIYVPIIKGMYGKETIQEAKWQVAGWCRYIDEHIGEDFSVKELAARWRYSEQNFRMIFEMYYGEDPEEYIRKKKQVDVESLDLMEYYKSHKKDVHIKFRTIRPIRAAVKLLDRAIRNEHIPATTAWWFTHDFDCLKGTAYEIDERERPSRIFIWKDEPTIIDGEEVYDYYLGPVIKKNAGVPEGMKEIVIEGGTYAVFRTIKPSDKDDLAETYRMLTRIAFGGWIHEMRYRIDYSRATFINYKRQKLFFYVPIIL